MEQLQIDTLASGYKIIQDKERFMYGIDAVLLSAFAFCGLKKKKQKIADLGTGNGIIPLLLASAFKTQVEKISAEITGIEIQKASAQLAQKSVLMNRLQNQISIINGDLKRIDSFMPKHCMQVVISNPPYMLPEHGLKNSADAKTIARHEVLCSLEDVISAADYLLLPRGSFFMIHRPFRLPEIFAALKAHKMEPKKMQLIYPFEDKEPNLVLLEARKNAQPELKILPNLIVREKDGQYTEKINEMYALFGQK